MEIVEFNKIFERWSMRFDWQRKCPWNWRNFHRVYQPWHKVLHRHKFCHNSRYIVSRWWPRKHLHTQWPCTESWWLRHRSLGYSRTCKGFIHSVAGKGSKQQTLDFGATCFSKHGNVNMFSIVQKWHTAYYQHHKKLGRSGFCWHWKVIVLASFVIKSFVKVFKIRFFATLYPKHLLIS